MMKKISLFLALLLTTVFGFSQQVYKVDYEELKKFEGRYEYYNHTTIEMAASPKDTMLFAIFDKSRYTLTPIGKDSFLNMQKVNVTFFRDQSNAIAGYINGSDTFKLVNKNVFFPNNMWYPRPENSRDYTYKKPKDLKDGLSEGDINKSGLDTALLSEMMRKIIDGTYPNVHSILIIKDGKLVFEEYFYEYTIDSFQELRSATKSFTSALTGIAIEKGFIKNENEKVLSYFPDYNFSNNSKLKQQITIKNLLTQQTGLDCDISNNKSEGNETTMSNTNDWVKFTLDLPMIDTPGGKGMYCSGNFITLGRIIEKTTHQQLPLFARQTLFAPMGITNFKWSFKPDKSSSETFCQLYLRPRDMAKFGLLYLDKGKWNGKKIIPPDWIEQSFIKHSVIQGVDYGYLWWLKYLDVNGVRYHGKAAQGNGGQKIYIWEKQNMVTVITGGNYNTQSPSDELIKKYILAAFNNK